MKVVVVGAGLSGLVAATEIQAAGHDVVVVEARTRVGGRVVQDGSTSDMVFGIGELLAFVTRWITLEPGDVLLTGSPAGVGPMVPGDIVEVEISGIGTLRNTVADRG